MGACDFRTIARGKTAAEAFSRAVADAQHDYGHAGYTGTIAEKHDFKVIPLPADKTPAEAAEALIDACDPRVEDKWGPAGCFDLGDGRFLFFGWASS